MRALLFTLVVLMLLVSPVVVHAWACEAYAKWGHNDWLERLCNIELWLTQGYAECPDPTECL